MTMPKADGPSSYIFEGVWSNWGKGRVLGSTLTLSAHDASLLSPALATLISIAGGQLWRLSQFAIHQIRATPAKQNYLFHFQQVALRNTAVDINALWRFIRFAFAYRHEKEIRSFSQSAPLILFTLLHVVLLILASLFSSRLLNAGNEVLSRSPYCGVYNSTYTNALYRNDSSDETFRQRMEYRNNINSIFASIQQHVDICQTSVDGCDNTRPVRSLESTAIILDAKCPFDSSICHPDIDGAMALDTGFISSHSDLGFNFPEKDRMSFRIFTQCAPLDSSRFASGWQDVAATPERPGHQIADALYGPSKFSQRNSTWSIVRDNMQCEQKMVTSPYTLNVQHAAPGGSVAKGTADFDPIPELRLRDADTDLILLSFIGAYEGPVSDPWFSARTEYVDPDAYCQNLSKQLYTRDFPITAMACSTQWQICISDTAVRFNSTSCTPLLARSQLLEMVSSDPFHGQLNSRQLATIQRIFEVANQATLNQVINKLSQATVAPLQARHNISDTVGRPLPSYQWQIEAQYWFSILLAYVQEMSLQLGTGQFAASKAYVNITRPSDTDQVQRAAYEICQNQLIRSASYQNFNFFALVLTTSLCVVIIILGLLIEDTVGSVRRHRNEYTKHLQSMWMRNLDIEMLKTISILKTKTPWSRSACGVPLASAGSMASVEDLGVDTWSTLENRGVVHYQTMTGLQRYGLGNHPPGTSQERLVDTDAMLHVDSDDSSTSEVTNPDLLETSFPVSQDSAYELETPIRPFETHSYRVRAASRGRRSCATNVHDVGQSRSPSDDERNSSELQPFVSHRYGSGDDSNVSVRHNFRLPIIRFTPPSDNDLFSQYQRSAKRSRSVSLTRPPSGWGLMPTRLSGLWPPQGVTSRNR